MLKRPHPADATYSNAAPAMLPNNLNAVIEGHEASALVDTRANYSLLSGRLTAAFKK